jgi:RNAse (barnase) inhibitor barstar
VIPIGLSLTRATPPEGVARVDGSACRTRLDLLTEWSRALDVPDYFGRNWDAFADVLSERLERGPLAVAVDNAVQLLADESPDQLRMLIEVLDGVTVTFRGSEDDETTINKRLDQASGR